MKKFGNPRPRHESTPPATKLVNNLKNTVSKLWNGTRNFVERNGKYTPVLAAGALATAYGVVKGYTSADMLGSHLETLGTNFISTRDTAAPETDFESAATGVLFGTGSVLAGIGAIVGVAAHKVKHVGEPENTITAGLFVEEQRELVPQHQGGGLYIIQGGAAENQPTQHTGTSLTTLLGRAA